MSDRFLRRSGDDYFPALSALLPSGPAWPREISTTIMKVVRGLARFWGYVDGRAADLLEREADPRSTTEMLLDWERAFGLPDKCLDEPISVSERRAALITRITLLGGQSRQFFIDLAASIGYPVTITEYSPYTTGISACGWTKHLNPDDAFLRYRWQLGSYTLRYYWTVHVTGLRAWKFHCAGSQCGIDRLTRISIASDLECIFNRYKPSHTHVVFDYSALA